MVWWVLWSPSPGEGATTVGKGRLGYRACLQVGSDRVSVGMSGDGGAVDVMPFSLLPGEGLQGGNELDIAGWCRFVWRWDWVGWGGVPFLRLAREGGLVVN